MEGLVKELEEMVEGEREKILQLEEMVEGERERAEAGEKAISEMVTT